MHGLRHIYVAARMVWRALTKISAVNPLTSLLGGGAGGKSEASKKGFRDILLFAVSKLRGELLRRPGDTARLRKGLLEDRLTDRVAVSRAAVLGEGRRASAGFKNVSVCGGGGRTRGEQCGGGLGRWSEVCMRDKCGWAWAGERQE